MSQNLGLIMLRWDSQALRYLCALKSSGCVKNDIRVSEAPLPDADLRSETALGVLAPEEMLDRATSLSLLLLPLCEDLHLSDSVSDKESDEKSRESVRPASAIRRRLRSAVPSRLQLESLVSI